MKARDPTPAGRLILAAFVACVATVLQPGSAMAAITTAYGSWSYYYAGSIQYGDRAQVEKETSISRWHDGVYVGRVSGPAVPAGWLGVKPRLLPTTGHFVTSPGGSGLLVH